MGGKRSGGRNRKPTAIKKAEGNRGKRELNELEPAAKPGAPAMPAKITSEAKAVWPEVVDMLEKNGVLFESDGIAIAVLCSDLALFRQADARVADHHLAIEQLETAIDKETADFMRWSRARSDAEKHLRATWQAFGLDPASRPGVQVSDRPERKPTSALEQVIRAKSNSKEIVN